MSVAAGGTRESSLKIAVLLCGIDVSLMAFAALQSNSITILSDFFKESTDFLAVLAAFLTVRAVRRSPNERFAYGVGKLENLVSMGIGLLMLGAAVFVITQALGHLRHPRPAEGTLVGLLIFSAYAVIGFVLWARIRLSLREQSSAILASQASLWFSKALFDALMACALGLGLIFAEQRWSHYLDPLAALVGAAFLLHGAWAITSSSVGDLLDATLEESLKLRIMRHLVEHFDDYERLHGLRARRSGPRVYVEIFLEFAADLPSAIALERIEAMRAEMTASIPGAEISFVLSRTGPPAG
ncbi:MAG: cation diffusion facilitator family transporter [Burkholderiaceae bacterium]